MKTKDKIKRWGLITLGVVGILYAGLAIATLVVPKEQPQVAQPAPTEKPVFKLDPEIAQLGKDLGIPEQALIDTKASFGDPTTICQHVSSGCYNGTIVIARKPDLAYEHVLLGHEYMHYVWDKKLNEATKDKVSSLVNDFYTKYQVNVQNRFSDYDARGADDPNERQAIFCTEISDARLQPELRDYCAQWLPNRDALPSYF